MSEAEPMTFREHHEKVDAYVDAVNAELRQRGFHACEVHAWSSYGEGQVILKVSAPTSGKNPMGGTIFLQTELPLPLPWRLPADKMMEPKEILNQALKASEKMLIRLCGQHKILRITFAAFARAKSQTIQTDGIVSNGRPKLVTP